MDPKKNPYAPGAGTQPPELTGRDEILKTAEIALARIRAGRGERPMLLTGLRGVGKTVLLNRIYQLAEREGYFVDLIEAPEDRSLAELLIPSLRQALIRISAKAKLKSISDKALRVLKSFSLSMNVDGEFSLRYQPEKGLADSGDIERDLSEVFVAVGETAKSSGVPVAILIDEIQYLQKTDLAALIVATHRVSQRSLPVAIVGAGLPLLPALTGDAKSYAERLFTYPRIGALNKADSRKALDDPARELGVSYERLALDEIVKQTRGYPYFVQEWGYEVWNLARKSPITVADVKLASRAAEKRLDEGFFRVRLGHTTDTEQRYLRAIASIGPRPWKTGKVAQALGKNLAQCGPVRDALIKKGMIYSPRHGQIDFTVPMFDRFLRRALPPL